MNETNIGDEINTYACLDRYLIYNVDTYTIKRAAKLIYAFRVALSTIFVTYLLYNVIHMIMRYRRRDQVDRLTLYS